MDLRSGLPFFLLRHGLPYNYPKLEKSIKTDVAIIGGGISGALMAYHLTKAGIGCVVLDARSIALGSTAASTSFLQYEIDVSLHELSEKIGYADASRAFTLCKESIEKLEHIAHAIGMKHFDRKDSLYFASHKKDITYLKKEYQIRKKSGFKVAFMDESDIRKTYGFKSDAAILSHHGARTDAYSFTHALFQYSIRKGLEVFDRTTIKTIKRSGKGMVLRTENGHSINAKKVINATGYEVVDFLKKKIVKLQSTYAVISEHMENEKANWSDDTLFWNTADPYLYMTSVDGRIMIGGRDEDFYNPARRDKMIKKKSRQLVHDFLKLFPHIPLKQEFSWTGTFGATADGLPFIGASDKSLPVYYALGFGGNGITFSLIAAEMIRDLITGKPHKDMKIFSFDRI